MRFGHTVRRRRESLGLTLEQVAESAGLTPNYVGSVELGRRDPSLSTIVALARALGLSPGELLGTRELDGLALEAGRLFQSLPTEAQDPLLSLMRAPAKRRK